jgi:hypothetical protein
MIDYAVEYDEIHPSRFCNHANERRDTYPVIDIAWFTKVGFWSAQLLGSIRLGESISYIIKQPNIILVRLVNVSTYNWRFLLVSQ